MVTIATAAIRAVAKILALGVMSLSLSLSTVRTCSAQEKGTPKGETTQKIEGWRSATWGMSEEQILNAFKGEAKKLAKEEKWRTGGSWFA